MSDKDIYDLAKFMHDEYEIAARNVGWKTQESCRVEFDSLPEANKKVMLHVAEKVLDKHIGYLVEATERLAAQLETLTDRISKDTGILKEQMAKPHPCMFGCGRIVEGGLGCPICIEEYKKTR